LKGGGFLPQVIGDACLRVQVCLQGIHPRIQVIVCRVQHGVGRLQGVYLGAERYVGRLQGAYLGIQRRVRRLHGVHLGAKFRVFRPQGADAVLKLRHNQRRVPRRHIHTTPCRKLILEPGDFLQQPYLGIPVGLRRNGVGFRWWQDRDGFPQLRRES